MLLRPSGANLRIDAGDWDHAPQHGDSIAVNGCCLTVAAPPGTANTLQFDVVTQTLKMTTLGGLRSGAEVNLEHSVTPLTLMGGHIVQGHIDAVAEVADVRDDTTERRLRLRIGRDLMPVVVDKGSVAVEGVSLTVADVGEDWFEVALIPTTIQQTTLGSVIVGDRLNVETDYIARVVANVLRRMR